MQALLRPLALCSSFSMTTPLLFLFLLSKPVELLGDDPFGCLRLVQHQSRCSQIFFSRAIFEPLHLHQIFPYNSLSSSISAISSVPINSIPPLPLRRLKYSQSFSSTYQRWHERNRPLARNTFRNQEEHRRASLLRPLATLLQFLHELRHFSSCFFCQNQGNFWVDATATHSCFCLIQTRCLLQLAHFEPWQARLPPVFFHSSFFFVLSSVCCTLSPH